jgi:hypothetical protein
MEIYRADILRKRELRQKSRDAQPQTSPLIAQLIGSRGCEALGIVATGNAPVKEQNHGRAQFARWKPFPSSPVGSPMRKNRRRAA